MKNPWLQLAGKSPHVLDSDLSPIEAFNARFVARPEFAVQTQLLPEPFIGNPAGCVYVLGLNPGYSAADDDWHGTPRYAQAISDNVQHKPRAYPFYFFDPELASAPGSRWWIQRSRWLINDVGMERLATDMFCVELFPYHSQKYKPLPKSISPNGLVASSAYSAHLVRNAMRVGKPIVAMRAFAKWCKLVPELKTYGKIYRLNSPQNVSLSPKNIDRYDQLVRAFTLTARNLQPESS